MFSSWIIQRYINTKVDGIHILSLAARFSLATRSTTLADGLPKIQAALISDRVNLHVFHGLGRGYTTSLHGTQHDRGPELRVF